MIKLRLVKTQLNDSTYQKVNDLKDNYAKTIGLTISIIINIRLDECYCH